jgi:hypothetical protein
MAIHELYSARQRRLAERGNSDPYRYDDIPAPLRVQIVGIIRDALGQDPDYTREAFRASIFKHVHLVLARELGLFQLGGRYGTAEERVVEHFLAVSSAEQVLDVVELFFGIISNFVRRSNELRQENRPASTAAAAIEELNQRFQLHAIGFQFVEGEIVRVDSQFIHTEVTLETLRLIHGNEFSSANEEFLRAHEHYRHERFEECVVAALAAFESTMKIICSKREWTVEKGATTKALIAACLKNGLLPQMMESQLSAVRSTLESGLPAVRNNMGGHGKGTDTTPVPAYFARYALNTAATTILLIVEADQALPQ